MPKTSASIFQALDKAEIQNLESSFFISPLLARNSVYFCSAIYTVFSLGYLMGAYSFELHEGLESSSINEVVFTPMLIFSLSLLSAAIISYFTVNSYHKTPALIIFYAINCMVLVGSLATYFILRNEQNYFQPQIIKECYNTESLVYSNDLIYLKAKNLLCSQDCPCTLINSQNYPQSLISTFNLTTAGSFGSQQIQNCDSAYSTDNNLKYFANQMKSLEETYQCSGLCTQNSIFIYSNINLGIPKRSCTQAMISYLDKALDIFVHSKLFLSIISILNQVFLWILQSRYILQVKDEDLFGKDSEGDDDDDLISNCSKINNSTIDTLKHQRKKSMQKMRSQDYNPPQQLSLEKNNTFLRRRKLLENNQTTTSLPLPLILEKRESEIMENFIKDIGKTVVTEPDNIQDNNFLSVTPKFRFQKQQRDDDD